MLAVLALWFAPACSTSLSAESGSSSEYELKAAFLLNFAKFVEWPANAFRDEKTPFTMCIFGHDPFGSALDQVVRGKNLNTRVILVSRTTDLAGLKTCQLVFISEKEEKQLPHVFESLNGASALVVGESDDFAERGGSIQFFVENSRMRFAVNVDAVQRARLTVSSKLLILAKIVHDQNHSKGT